MEAESTIKSIMEQFSKHNLNELELRLPDFELRLVKDSPAAVQYATPQSIQPQGFQPQSVQLQTVQPVVEQKLEAEKTEGETIRANLVGTFYSRPSKDAEPFVKPGQKVKKGEAMCIIEAMKIMNELCAPYDLVVKNVCCEDAKMIEYNQILFEVEKC